MYKYHDLLYNINLLYLLIINELLLGLDFCLLNYNLLIKDYARIMCSYNINCEIIQNI